MSFSGIEDYDDSPEREARWQRKNASSDPEFAARIEASIRQQPVRCPYCTAAKKGGAHGDLDHKDAKGVTHKVRVVREIPTGKMSMTVWVLEAACGAEFRETVDSGD